MRAQLMALSAGVVVLCSAFKVDSETRSPDAVSRAWTARAELAARRLAGPGLDACDQALERAFQHAEENMTSTGRAVVLRPTMGKDSAVVTYFYEGSKLSTFSIAAMPRQWILMQKASSKLLSVFPDGTKCAFDLCTSDPLAEGACPNH